MKFNLKTVLVIDAVILLLGISTFLFGQQIGDFLHPSPNKAFYKEVNNDLDNLFTDLDSGKLNEQVRLEDRIDQINQKTIDHSNSLYSKVLDGKMDSLSNLETILSNLNDNHIYSGDRSMLAIYMGSLIKAKAPADWGYDTNNSSLILRSTKNEETVDLSNYIEDRIYDSGASADVFYNESIKQLGGE